jgi:hypothetical protein
MGIKKALTCFLMDRLPPEEQASMVTDLIAWRLTTLPPAAQQKGIEGFGPGLLRMMRTGLS